MPPPFARVTLASEVTHDVAVGGKYVAKRRTVERVTSSSSRSPGHAAEVSFFAKNRAKPTVCHGGRGISEAVKNELWVGT